MWPAVMFAASRKESVIGRRRILSVSISTRNGLSHAGAPPGSRDAATDEGAWATPEIMSLSQRGSPKDTENRRWAEVLKT
jgi:hypothetical protein